MDKLILTTEYMGPISSYWLMNHSSEVIEEAQENYQKKSTRNRARILGANGVKILSVPLAKGKNNKMSIQEVHISYEEDWVSSHIQAIKSAYGNSPYYEFYFDDLKRILNERHQKLIELNSILRNYFIEQIGMEVQVVRTSEYLHSYTNATFDLRKSSFGKRKMKAFIPKKYNQVFEDKFDFVEDLSILDLLMCKGPESILYI